MKPIRFYYTENDEFVYLDNTTNEFGRHKCYDTKETTKYNYFELFKNFEKTNIDLVKFKEKFKIDTEQLNKHDIQYEKYYNNYNAVRLIFQRYSTNNLKKYTIQSVSTDEYEFAEKCYNGGIIYLNEKYKNKTINCYGYDYSSFYPNTLVNEKLYIPKNKGKKIHLENIDFANLKFGIYRVNITSNHKDVKKIFCFSKKGYYTHYSLKFIYQYREQFNMHIELNTDCEHNAIIYEDTDLIQASLIFKTWFDKLSKVKQNCKGNILIKHLFSSLWGSLCKLDVQYVTDEQLKDLDCNRDNSCEYKLIDYQTLENGYVRNRIIKTAKPYENNLARLKPYVLALSRNIIAEFIIDNDLLENVIRIHTDGVCLDCELEFEEAGYYPIPEKKTTGLITWNSVNDYLLNSLE